MDNLIYATIFFEAILVIIIGVASNNISNKFWTGVLILCGVFYIFILIWRATYKKKFPNAIADELISSRELEQKNALLNRQNDINNFVCTSIQALNAQTCAISFPEEDNAICKNSLKAGLISLLYPLVEQTEVVFNSPKIKKFTVAIYTDSIWDGNTWENESMKKSLMVLRDDLFFSEILVEDFLEDKNCKGACYEIQTATNRTLNNNAYTEHTFEREGVRYSIICSPIPVICNDEERSGATIMIMPNDIDIPLDIPNILAIFNRITVNYIQKYNDCIRERLLANSE